MKMQHWPSSPLQPPEFDMTPQIFQTEPKVREENLQRTTWPLKLHETSHIRGKLIRTEGEDQFGAWCDWLSEVSRHNQRSVSWVDYVQCCMHILSAKDYLWLVLHLHIGWKSLSVNISIFNRVSMSHFSRLGRRPNRLDQRLNKIEFFSWGGTNPHVGR